MKKRTMVLAVILVLVSTFFVACNSNSATNTVKELVKASVNKESKDVERMLQYSEFKGKNTDKLMEEISGINEEMGGLDKAEFKEYSKKHFKEEIVQKLEKIAGKDFKVVTMKNEKKQYQWLLKKLDGKYYIISADDQPLDDMLK